MDDLYVDTFEVKDVKPLHGDHLARFVAESDDDVYPICFITTPP